MGKWLGCLTLGAVLAADLGAVSYDAKGMQTYKNICKTCHGSGDYGAAQLRQDEWQDLFMFGGKKLINAHQNDPVAKEIFADSVNVKKFKSLENFLVGSAKDAGNVGGCDGNRCGVQSGKILMKK